MPDPFLARVIGLS